MERSPDLGPATRQSSSPGPGDSPNTHDPLGSGREGEQAQEGRAQADHRPVCAGEGRAQANHRRVRAGGRGGPDLGGVLLCPGVADKVTGLFREDPPPTPELQIRVGPEFNGTWLYPSTRSDLGNPPTEYCDTNEYGSWLRASKAVPAANSFVVILRSNTASTVIVEGMSVQVRDRRPPLDGILLECAIGGWRGSWPGRQRDHRSGPPQPVDRLRDAHRRTDQAARVQAGEGR
jgi:hypothetical protein